MTLCNLEDVKTLLGITDNSADAKLTLMIKAVSSQIQSYLGYKLAMADYTEELHSVMFLPPYSGSAAKSPRTATAVVASDFRYFLAPEMSMLCVPAARPVT